MYNMLCLFVTIFLCTLVTLSEMIFLAKAMLKIDDIECQKCILSTSRVESVQLPMYLHIHASIQATLFRHSVHLCTGTYVAHL